MFFPNEVWWDSAEWQVPDSLKYLCERWWELLRDWRSIAVFSPPTNCVLSLLEDFSDVLDDVQAGRLRTCHQVDGISSELESLVKSNQLLQTAFPSEVSSLLTRITSLYDQLPADPQQKYAQIKGRKLECRLAASSARRLHHRCLRRRQNESDMTWIGMGGLIEAELIREIEVTTPNYPKIDRLLTAFLLDALYRGYNSDYLTTLFDRYLPQASSVRDGLLHAFRRLHSMMRHEYEVLLVLNGATSVDSAELGSISVYSMDELNKFSIEENDKEAFAAQMRQDSSVVLGVECADAPDAGAAAEAARKRLQEIVDFLDFQKPTQGFDIPELAIVTWTDSNSRAFARPYPDERDEKPAITGFKIEIDSSLPAHLSELAEALRWSSVARREKSPEVSLLASWFAFEFLGGNLERTPVEGIMEYFPKVLAIGNLKRRLIYWWKSLSAHSEFEKNGKKEQLEQRVIFHGGGLNLGATLELLVESSSQTCSDEAKVIKNIASKSVLLRERTKSEAKLFGNPQMIAQTLSQDVQRIERELQNFLVIRNKLVHRARIDHPLLPLVAKRAEARLYDLLRDLSGQLSVNRIDNSVPEVFRDFRDTFDELLVDLGQNKVVGAALINRITLS